MPDRIDGSDGSGRYGFAGKRAPKRARRRLQPRALIAAALAIGILGGLSGLAIAHHQEGHTQGGSEADDCTHFENPPTGSGDYNTTTTYGGILKRPSYGERSWP